MIRLKRGWNSICTARIKWRHSFNYSILVLLFLCSLFPDNSPLYPLHVVFLHAWMNPFQFFICYFLETRPFLTSWLPFHSRNAHLSTVKQLFKWYSLRFTAGDPDFCFTFKLDLHRYIWIPRRCSIGGRLSFFYLLFYFPVWQQILSDTHFGPVTAGVAFHSSGRQMLRNRK